MDAPLALYVHWPFCLSKCPYCDFNSHVADSIDPEAWRVAYLSEIERLAADLPGRSLGSLFFGGGTPSLMPPDLVHAVIEAARAAWPGEEPEITLEANPTSVEAMRLRGFREAGVNRLSIGIQSLDDDALRWLGRAHSAEEARLALDLAIALFPRVSADLIYARPGQDAMAWRQELDAMLAFGLGHLSLYQLTIERGTPFFAAARKGTLILPDEETAARLYEETSERLARQGFTAYEISNHAREGMACRHNLAYWRGEDYAGIGPGAHGRLHLDGAPVATEALRNPRAWLEAARHGSGQERRTILTPDVRAEELLMMGLRLAEGVEERRFRRASGLGFAETFAGDRLERLIDGGFLSLKEGILCATPEGRLRLDAVLGALLG